MTRDYMVTVCAECECASCWHGEFMCDKSMTADVKEVRASELEASNREHAHHYSTDTIRKVTGADPQWVPMRPTP